MHHSHRLKVKSFFFFFFFFSHYYKTVEANLIRLHEKLNNNDVICHNQNQGS